jgi:voltage-gated potassium channel
MADGPDTLTYTQDSDPRPEKELRVRVHEILDEPHISDKAAKYVQILIFSFIFLNTIAIVLISIPDVRRSMGTSLLALMNLSLGVFAIEYGLRIWSCTSASSYSRRLSERLRYATQPLLIIDLLTILPIFTPFLVTRHILALRALRLLAVFRLLRFSKYSESVHLLRSVLLKKKEIIGIFGIVLIYLILFGSTLLFLVENEAQPEAFSSIPAAMWCVIMTVTTVGYGDIYPITALGKTITACITLTGVLLLALPSAILAAGFIEERARHIGPGSRSHTHITFRPDEVVDLLERLVKLKEMGHLTQEEFEKHKTEVLRQKQR